MDSRIPFEREEAKADEVPRRFVLPGKRLPGLIGLLLLLCLATATAEPAAAQDAPVCTPFVEQALAEVGNGCSGLERNSVCYGWNRVDATFTEPVAPDFFSQPADRAPLIDVEQLRTVALNFERKEWGVAVMNVQANVPGTLPGQAVTFVLIGDATLDNAVAADSALTAVADPIQITAATNANIRSGPGITANVVGGVVAGTTLDADGLSADLGWLRVLYDDAPAWISRSVIGPADGIEALPVILRKLAQARAALGILRAPLRGRAHHFVFEIVFFVLAAAVERVDDAIHDVVLCRRRHVLPPERIAGRVDLRKCRRRDA